MIENSVMLGERLKSMRVARGVSRAELAMHLAISEKTLQRIELGQVDAKAAQCLSLLNYFAVSPATFLEGVHTALPAPATVYRQLIDAADNPAALAALEADYTRRFKSSHAHWLRRVAAGCAVLRSALNHQPQQATQQAERLVQGYLTHGVLSTLDFRLLALVARFSRYSQLEILLTSAALATYGDDAAFARFATGLLDSALAANNSEALRGACTWLQQQKAAAAWLPWQRLAACLLLRLNGDCAQASQQFAALKAGVAALYPSAASTPLRQALTARFNQAPKSRTVATWPLLTRTEAAVNG